MEQHPAGRGPSPRTTLVATVAALLVLLPVAAWAGHRFSDVPTSNVFHDDIDWLADTGVTRGCNPPDNTRFCPSDPVTREQIAAFLHRLETEDVLVSTGDAQTYDARTVVQTSTTATALPASTNTRVADVAITVPAAGTIVAEYDATVVATSDTATIYLGLRRSSDPCSDDVGFYASTSVHSATEADQAFPMSGMAYLDVDGAGTHSFRLCGFSSTAASAIRNSAVQLTWHPAAGAASDGISWVSS